MNRSDLQCFRIPFVGRVIIFDAAFHVLQLIQHSKHVDELPQSQQVCLGDKVFPALCVTQTTDLSAETVNCHALQERRHIRSINQANFMQKKIKSPLNA